MAPEDENAGEGMLSGWPDRDLVLAHQAGDPDAYAAIDHKYRPMVSRICKRMITNAHDAEDATQEVMIRVLKGLDRFNGQYKLEAWVARIAQNHSLDVIRATQRRPEQVENPHADNEGEQPDVVVRAISLDDPGREVEDREERDEVRIALSEIPEHHRAALVMREWNGASHEEIADALGLTAPRAKALIHRAKRSFREVWATKPWVVRALVPLFFLRRLADLFRRVPAEQTDVAANLATTQVASVAPLLVNVAPVAQQAASAVGERVVATVTAVVVTAGSLGVGVAVNQSRPAAKPKVRTLVAEPALPPDLLVVSSSTTGPSPTPEAPNTPSPSTEAAPSATPSPVASDSPSASPSPSGSTSSSPSPSPEPAPSNSPSPAAQPDPPPYRAALRVRASSNDTCDCSKQTTVDQSTTSGTAGDAIRFTQEVRGAATDDENDDAWRYWLWFDGHAEKSNGTMDFTFELQAGQNAYQYKGVADLMRMREENGGHTYVFTGHYELSDGNPSMAPIGSGSFTMTQAWWRSTDALYGVSVEVQPS